MRPRSPLELTRVLAALIALGGLSLSDVAFAQEAAAVPEAPKAAPAEVVSTTAEAERPKLNVLGRTISLLVPARERGPLGQVNIEIEPDDSLKVRAEDLTRILAPLVRKEFLDRISALADSNGYIGAGATDDLGLILTFDPALLELVLTIPLEARQRRTVPLGLEVTEDQGDTTDRSEPFAIYLNYRASLDYFHVDDGNREAGLRSPRIDADLNGRTLGVAFENRVTYDGDLDRPWTRSGSRLIYDHRPSALRWTAGDLISRGISFQGSPELAGISVSRETNILRSGRIVTARTSRSLTLREPANVELLVNGQLSRRLRLEPGEYDLRDLPLTQGANDVEIVVISDSGAREVVSFDFFSDTSLLAPGIDEFYAGAGIRTEFDDGEIEYFTDVPVFTGYYRRGLTEQLTGGAFLQADDQTRQLGIESLYGSRIGLLYGSLAASDSDRFGSGYAVKFELRRTRELPEFARSRETIGLSLEARSNNFVTVQQEAAGNAFSFSAIARYSRPLRTDLEASFGLEYNKGRGAQEDRYGANAFLSWRLPRDTDLTFGLSYSNGSIDGKDVRASIGLTRRFGSRSTFTASAETENNRVRASYARGAERPLNDWSYSADVVRTDDIFGVSGNATYNTTRGDAEFAHVTTFDNDGADVTSQQSSLRFSGSFAFAGSRAGIGRPIQDSFAIVGGHSSLKGRSILLRPPTAEAELARSGALGPAVLPLGSYYRQQIPYDVEDLPAGYDLGSGNFEVFPWLHSGFDFTVGSAYNVTVLADLVDRNGQPLQFASGTATNVADAEAPVVPVATNRTGRLGASGLSAGQWRIRMGGVNGLSYLLNVPPETTLFRAGRLTPLE